MYSSPFSTRKKSPIKKTYSTPSYSSKSPIYKDRYINYTPKKLFSDESSDSNSPFSRSPSKSSYRTPKINQIKLDAPDLYDMLPSQLIAWKENGDLAIALGTKVYIYYPETEDILDLTEDGFGAVVQAVCWVGDRVVISGAGEIQIWSVRKKKAIRDLESHNGRACAISSCGLRLATGGSDGEVHIYDLGNESMATFSIGSEEEILKLSWSPEGEYLAVSCADCRVYVIGAHMEKRFVHKSPVYAMTWMQNTLLTGDSSKEGIISRFSIPSGHTSQITATGSPVSGMHWSDKWGLIITNREIPSYWKMYGFDFRLHERFQVENDKSLDLAFSDSKDFVAVLSNNETLILAKLQEQRIIHSKTPSPFKCSKIVR